MKKVILIFLLQLAFSNLFAHEHGHGTPGRAWELKIDDAVIYADFIKETDGVVYLFLR
mgnify:CR=1 FL=1